MESGLLVGCAAGGLSVLLGGLSPLRGVWMFEGRLSQNFAEIASHSGQASVPTSLVAAILVLTLVPAPVRVCLWLRNLFGLLSWTCLAVPG